MSNAWALAIGLGFVAICVIAGLVMKPSRRKRGGFDAGGGGQVDFGDGGGDGG